MTPVMLVGPTKYSDILQEGRGVFISVTSAMVCPYCGSKNSWRIANPISCRITDLPEARRLIGCTQCPDCVMTSGVPRADVDHEDIVAQACRVWVQGTVVDACAVLATADLVASHLTVSCPYAGLLPSTPPTCLPGDRLHLMCALAASSSYTRTRVPRA